MTAFQGVMTSNVLGLMLLSCLVYILVQPMPCLYLRACSKICKLYGVEGFQALRPSGLRTHDACHSFRQWAIIVSMCTGGTVNEVLVGRGVSQ